MNVGNTKEANQSRAPTNNAQRKLRSDPDEGLNKEKRFAQTLRSCWPSRGEGVGP